MSEYQYYEFQAIDRSLSDEQQQRLRRISSRAHITPTGFVTTYNYGDLHADPVALLEKYFDTGCRLPAGDADRPQLRINLLQNELPDHKIAEAPKLKSRYKKIRLL